MQSIVINCKTLSAITMNISTAIEERAPGRLCVLRDSIPQQKSGKVLQGKAIGFDLKHTECKVMAFDIPSSAGLSVTGDGNECPAATAAQAGPVYVSSRHVAGQYEIDKASLQIPQIVIDKYRRAKGYTGSAASTLQIYA